MDPRCDWQTRCRDPPPPPQPPAGVIFETKFSWYLIPLAEECCFFINRYLKLVGGTPQHFCWFYLSGELNGGLKLISYQVQIRIVFHLKWSTSFEQYSRGREVLKVLWWTNRPQMWRTLCSYDSYICWDLVLEVILKGTGLELGSPVILPDHYADAAVNLYLPVKAVN